MRSRKSQVYGSPRQLERERNILNKARQLLNEVGFEQMTMAQLADRAGVARATLYNLYENKDTLALAAIQDNLDIITERVENEHPLDGVDAIITRALAGTSQIMINPDYSREMCRLVFRSKAGSPLVELLFRYPHQRLLANVEVAQKLGQIEPWVDASTLASQLIHHEWGLLVPWSLGTITDEELPVLQELGVIQLLLSVSKGKTRKKLQEELKSKEASLNP